MWVDRHTICVGNVQCCHKAGSAALALTPNGPCVFHASCRSKYVQVFDFVFGNTGESETVCAFAGLLSHTC